MLGEGPLVVIWRPRPSGGGLAEEAVVEVEGQEPSSRHHLNNHLAWLGQLQQGVSLAGMVLTGWARWATTSLPPISYLQTSYLLPPDLQTSKPPPNQPPTFKLPNHQTSDTTTTPHCVSYSPVAYLPSAVVLQPCRSCPTTNIAPAPAHSISTLPPQGGGWTLETHKSCSCSLGLSSPLLLEPYCFLTGPQPETPTFPGSLVYSLVLAYTRLQVGEAPASTSTSPCPPGPAPGTHHQLGQTHLDQ